MNTILYGIAEIIGILSIVFLYSYLRSFRNRHVARDGSKHLKVKTVKWPNNMDSHAAVEQKISIGIPVHMKSIPFKKRNASYDRN